jgi:acyl-[acyl-carrier-protein]-phospholipid O-acyltransferase/long-chain-fatty-acid--[acyl-carrier-protein] ligase
MATAQPDVGWAAGPFLWAEGLGGGEIAWLAVGTAVLLALAVCWFRPYAMLRLGLWLATHSLYRLHVAGMVHLPRHGGALLVCNSVSYLDWLLLLAAQRRPIRFVLFLPWARRWWLRHFLRWTGAIAVDGAAGPREVAGALRQARRALVAGEVVCLFIEGLHLRGGLELPFSRAFRLVTRGVQVPIIPACLDQERGTLFALVGGRPSWQRPMEWPHAVDVAFGPPLPAGTRIADVCAAVYKLSADCAVARAGRRRPVHRQFVRMAARHPFRPCFIDSSMPGHDLSYARALAGVLCFRRLLRPILGEERTVAIWLPPGSGGALSNITLAILGKTSVNLNYTSSPEVLHSALRQSGARHVLTSRRFTARMALSLPEGVEAIYLEDLTPQVGRWQRLRAWLAVVCLPGFVLERWLLRLGRHRVGDLATIIFSSGSTGEPKGVMLSHGNVAANTESMVQAIRLSARDRVLGVLPFFHSFGYAVTLWAPLQVGASAVYHPDPRQAKEIGELCRQHRCTIYLSTATFLRFCLRRCQPDDFRSLRVLICGAEKLPPSLADDFEKKFGLLPLEGYGCTELSPAAAANLPDVDVGGFVLVHNRPGSVGPPLPGVAVRVVHPETRAPLPAGEEGLLLVYGANVMQGYLNHPEWTCEAVRDGWYVTGDMARLDDDGFVTLTGRLSRFAKCGGEMVPLERIEEVLHEVLGTSERVCAVTCVPDEARGERIVVLYTPHEGLDVRVWYQQLGSRGLPNLWVPGERDFLRVSELPLLGSGKLNLQRVKEMALELARK